MYPFHNRFRWHLASRYEHLVSIIHDRVELPEGPWRPVLVARMRGLVIWARIRSVLFLLLYLSLVATALSMVARYFPAAGEASATVGFLARLTGTFTGVLTLAVVLVTRHLGQLEINVLGCLLHATPPRDGGSAVVDHEKAPHS